MGKTRQNARSTYERVVTWTRFLMYIPVISLFVGAVALVLLGGYETVMAIIGAFFDGSISEKQTLVDFIALADLFLLATVLYIIALGLFQLFIDDSLPLPHWLVVSGLDDLKEKLTSVIIVVLAVFFLGLVVKSTNPQEVMWEGLGVASVVLALSAFLFAFRRPEDEAPSGGEPRTMFHAMKERADIAEDTSGPTDEPAPSE